MVGRFEQAVSDRAGERRDSAEEEKKREISLGLQGEREVRWGREERRERGLDSGEVDDQEVAGDYAVVAKGDDVSEDSLTRLDAEGEGGAAVGNAVAVVV